MDFKQAAAGEREEGLDPFLQEMLKNAQQSARRHGHSWEFLTGALDWITGQTRVKLTEKEETQFLAKLSVYPRWKLLSLFDFTGKFTEIFPYLEGLRTDPNEPHYKALPAPEPAEREKTMAKEFFTHIAELFGTNDLTARAEIEMRYIVAMRKKYPQFNWQPGMHANRDAEL